MKPLFFIPVFFISACSFHEPSGNTETEYLILQKKQQQEEQKKFESPTSVKKERPPIGFEKHQ